MSWYWQYAGLIAFSTLLDYFIGRSLESATSQRKRKLLLVTSIGLNLGVLGIFKYYNFFFETAKHGFAMLGFEISDHYLNVLLPVGISFYTFQSLSYTIDIYRGKIKHEPSIIKFAVFVSFFPQLVAGPIVRAKDFLPQINKPTFISNENINFGLNLIVLGLFKKIVIADLLAYLAIDAVFNDPTSYSSWDLLIALYGYTFQIYCDFSGYSDIAIGLALLMGFNLPQNFNRPYVSQTPSDFWRRWHISLSGWLRDYLYISLGGNRFGKWLTFRNLMITMVLGGLWHGAAMNFVFWGAFHGLILIFTRNVVVEIEWSWKKVLKIFINFHFIVFSWLLFRVPDMETFFHYIEGVSKFSLHSNLSPLYLVILLLAFVIHFIPKPVYNKIALEKFNQAPIIFKSAIYTGILFLFIGASIGSPAFIYFQF